MKRSSYYINYFLRQSKRAGDMLVLGLFPNAKEITESMSMYIAVRNHCDVGTDEIKNEKILLISVGDGSTPRTAALFAFYTKWVCVSIDPALHKDMDWEGKVSRLNVLARKVEDFVFPVPAWFERVFIVNVHSHAGLDLVLPNIRLEDKNTVVDILALECCTIMDIPGVPFIGYTDQHVWSPKNLVKIWRGVKL
jgi:hypothetical protein